SEHADDDEDEIMRDSEGGTVLEAAFDDCDAALTRSILTDSRLIAQSNQLQVVSDMFRTCPISAEPVKPGGVLASAIEASTSSCRSDSESSTTDSESRAERGMSVVLGNKVLGELPAHATTVRGHTADTGQPVAVPLRLGGFEETDRSPRNGVLELQSEELRQNGGIRIRAEP
ncbi:hypothetical protein FOZ63_006954, partial [Perkinsus olseni]